MNKTHYLLTLGAALMLAPFTSTHAQTWVTVLDPAHGGIAGSSSDIGSAAAGNIYATGSTRQTTDGIMRATVLGSGDQGTTWSVLDQYAEPGLNYAHNRAVAADRSNGNLFAGGNLNNLLSNGSYEYDALWFIREWNPATLVWSTVDDSAALANDVGQASCADLLVTPSGDVYATGGSALGAGPGFLVRKRPAGASAFTTVDADYSRQTAGAGWDLGFHPSYGVFAVGEVKGIWTVRRSSNGNRGTWATVDSFTTRREWTSGRALCILVTPAKIHIAGSAYNASTGKTHWLIRTSADGGLTWTITDNFTSTGAAEARGIVQDASGNLVVCGSITATTGDLQWVVRKGTPGTKLVKVGKQWVQVETTTWTTSDTYQLATGKSAQPNAITTAAGITYVSGNAQDANGVNQWIVRKLPAQ